MKKIISLLLICTVAFCTIGITAYCADADIIQNPADGAVFYESPEAFGLNSAPYEKVVLYLDGEFYAECSTDSAAVQDELSLGTHTLKAVGIMADGSAVTDTNSFSIKQKADNSVGSWKTETITFDDLPEAYSSGTKMDAAMASSFSSKYGWDLVYTMASDVLDRRLTRIAGKNHATDPNDWAPLLSYGEVSSTVYGGNAGMSFAGAANTLANLKATGGTLTVEFDFLRSDRNVVLLYLPFSLWGESASGYNPQYLFASGSGALRGTATAISTNEWHSYKLQYDITNNKWYVWVDGAKLIDGVAADSKSHNKDEVTLQIFADKNKANSFAIDNFKMTHTKVYEGASKLEFVSPTGTSMDKDNFSPKTSQIKITMSDALNGITASDVTLRTTEGRKISSDVAYDNETKCVTITPKKQLTANTNMEIVFAKGLAYADGTKLADDYTIGVCTGNDAISSQIEFKADGKSVLSLKQLAGCSELKCTINDSLLGGAESFSGVYVMTVRQNEKITAITAKNISLDAGKTSDTITLTVPLPTGAENSEIYLMLCDSLNSLIAKSKYIRLK